jgi:hypothetical protein
LLESFKAFEAGHQRPAPLYRADEVADLPAEIKIDEVLVGVTVGVLVGLNVGALVGDFV